MLPSTSVVARHRSAPNSIGSGSEYLDCSRSTAALVAVIAKNLQVSLYSLKAAILGR
jgi:hypothetical protein